MRPVDVARPHDGKVQAIALVICEAKPVGPRFRRCIGAVRADFGVFGHRRLLRVAIHLAAAGVDDATALPSGGL